MVFRGFLVRDVTRRCPSFGETDRLFSCLWFGSRDVSIVFPVIYSIVLLPNTSPRLVSFVFHFISYSILVLGVSGCLKTQVSHLFHEEYRAKNIFAEPWHDQLIIRRKNVVVDLDSS